MSAQVIHLASEEAVDRAWEEYAGMAVQLYEDMRLMVDRDFQERLILARSKWLKLRGLRKQMR
jgi:hypothetical protein